MPKQAARTNRKPMNSLTVQRAHVNADAQPQEHAEDAGTARRLVAILSRRRRRLARFPRARARRSPLHAELTGRPRRDGEGCWIRCVRIANQPQRRVRVRVGVVAQQQRSSLDALDRIPKGRRGERIGRKRDDPRHAIGLVGLDVRLGHAYARARRALVVVGQVAVDRQRIAQADRVCRLGVSDRDVAGDFGIAPCPLFGARAEAWVTKRRTLTVVGCEGESADAVWTPASCRGQTSPLSSPLVHAPATDRSSGRRRRAIRTGARRPTCAIGRRPRARDRRVWSSTWRCDRARSRNASRRTRRSAAEPL